MSMTRRLDALEVRMAPIIDAEGELFARYIVATDGISYEELIAEGAHHAEICRHITRTADSRGCP